ncbi:uncharacterized protein LOC133909960 [Phragmites australis]|uniref:uncharacterized protein LOC133909960 n=1 Tax=Phragmites australis TaxID=29695 RepID=UPI002D79E91B|nr:uncharacterized protein LOC133909960 [Phragmites australis]
MVGRVLIAREMKTKMLGKEREMMTRPQRSQITRKDNLLSSSIGEVIQSKSGQPENKTKSERATDELASSADRKNVDKQKIKWKKIITKALKTNPDGVMKLKKLQKLVIKELQECGPTEDKEALRATLMDKIDSSSRFSVDGTLDWWQRMRKNLGPWFSGSFCH